MTLQVGSRFASYAEFEKTLRQYENKVFANYSVETSATLKRPNGYTTEEIERFKYKRIYLKCKFSGQHAQSINSVRNTTTYKQGCKSKIAVTFKKAENVLVVISLDEEHNHVQNSVLYKALPKQRSELIQNANELLVRVTKTKPNYILLQKEISSGSEKTGVVKRKDLYNFNAKNNAIVGDDDWEKLCHELQRVDSATVKIFHDRENQLEGLYFQDEKMKRFFDSYPEVLMFDATYSLNDRRMPLVILLIIDGNGESQIAGFFLVKSESIASLSQMFDHFKIENPKWDKIEVVITDKAMTNLNVVASRFPQAEHQLCIFHSKQIFLREITTKKRNINENQRSECLNIINKMIFASCQEEYDQQYERLRNTRCQGILFFFKLIFFREIWKIFNIKNPNICVVLY